VGKKSRQKKLRRRLRPMMVAAVAQARAEARSDVSRWEVDPASQLNRVEPEAPKPQLILPCEKAVAAVERSRR
jgi:hypothetical protein